MFILIFSLLFDRNHKGVGPFRHMENAAGRLGWQERAGDHRASGYRDVFSWTVTSFPLGTLRRSVRSNRVFVFVFNLSWESPAPLPCVHPPGLDRKGGREQFAPRLLNNWLNTSAKHGRCSAFLQSFWVIRSRVLKISFTLWGKF